MSPEYKHRFEIIASQFCEQVEGIAIELGFGDSVQANELISLWASNIDNLRYHLGDVLKGEDLKYLNQQSDRSDVSSATKALVEIWADCESGDKRSQFKDRVERLASQLGGTLKVNALYRLYEGAVTTKYNAFFEFT